jgi:16S rRNA (uracil1498-N3)-methyltransferase
VENPREDVVAERFFVEAPLAPGPISMVGPEAHHLASVRRFGPGDHVVLFNGDGCEYRARVVAVARRSVELEVVSASSPERELPFHLEVAAPLPKGDRAQFLIEKLTELGAKAYVPLECCRSVVHPRDTKLEKLQRWVIEASKQCGRNVLMRIEPSAAWADYCVPRSADEERWLGHPTGAATTQRRAARLRLAVGPEGGFTDEELGLAAAHGWQRISLGPRTLRVETAALALTTLASGGR